MEERDREERRGPRQLIERMSGWGGTREAWGTLGKRRDINSLFHKIQEDRPPSFHTTNGYVGHTKGL